MDGIGLIQDLAIVLLAAGLAGLVCRRLGLSVVVGYLLAGMVVGPYTPPFSFVLEPERIQALSQIGLVFLMFSIGLGLSLTRLARMGAGSFIATALGAYLMFNLTKALGFAVGWTPAQSLFIAAMFMVSSSAVIAKVVEELGLGHERPAQRALGITVQEDVVAVVMLTVLGASAGDGSGGVGSLLTGLTAFVALLVVGSLLMVPRLLRRLEARTDPEIQTIVVTGVLFLLALLAVKAGYSLALGAFLLGSIVAEIPQRVSVEKAFHGLRDVFSAVFFVSIGMLIEVPLLWSVWPWVLGLGVFVLVARPLALGTALLITGAPLPEARRASLLLAPLGEFSFIIAQMGVSTGVLPRSYYPLAVGVSLFTVLVSPMINRRAETMLGWWERHEPRWVSQLITAYQAWLGQLQSQQAPSVAWGFIRGRLVRLGLEVLVVTGVMLFAPGLLPVLLRLTDAFGLGAVTFTYLYWAAITVLCLVPLVAIWRNVLAAALIYAEAVSSPRVPASMVRGILVGAAALVLVLWLYALVPLEALGAVGWLAMALFAILVIAVYSRKLIYWYSEWDESVRSVFVDTQASPGLRAQVECAGLDDWRLRLRECVVPDAAACSGASLAELSFPARFGCVILEIERNGIVITALRPEVRVYPGDKLLLLGEDAQVEAAAQSLAAARAAVLPGDTFRGSVLETFAVPQAAWCGQTLAALGIGHRTGTRIVGIRRGTRQIIAPSGEEVLLAGDNLLVNGTLAEIAAFRRWLQESATTVQA